MPEAEPTTAEIERERDDLIAAMMRLAEAAPEPGTLQPRDVIHRGDDEYPAPVIARALSSAGYIFIYDTKTAERSLTNRNMLPTQLEKRRADGSRVFTTKRPDCEPVRGNLKCMLHADERRPEYEEWGFPTCRKCNLPTRHQVELHMRNRHRVEWETIERDRERREKEEDRARQERLILTLGSEKQKKSTGA